MNLAQVVKFYQTEPYGFFKYADKDGNPLNIFFHFVSHLDYLEEYLGFYRNMSDFVNVIEHAANGVFNLVRYGSEFSIRHNHQEVYEVNGVQKGVSYEITRQVANKLKNRVRELDAAKDF